VADQSHPFRLYSSKVQPQLLVTETWLKSPRFARTAKQTTRANWSLLLERMQRTSQKKRLSIISLDIQRVMMSPQGSNCSLASFKVTEIRKWQRDPKLAGGVPQWGFSKSYHSQSSLSHSGLINMLHSAR